MRYLITGGCGFLGSNLATEVIKNGEELFIFDNLFRSGSEKNFSLIKEKGKFKYFHSDIRNYNDVEYVIKEVKPDVVFHLAGQVAMTTSINNPRLDFEVNTLGTHNLLESVRKFNPESIIVYSSTNKVYGDLEQLNYTETETRYICEDYPNGFNENLPLNFQSPYGCSKGAADQYLIDYHKMFGIRTVVLRHSSMYGGNQHPTYDQGWIGWFINKASEIRQGILNGKLTINGNGKQVRDVLYVSDVVNLYLTIVHQIEKVRGKAFNIGGGINNSLSLLELFKFLEQEMNIRIKFENLPPRESDQKIFIADNCSITTFTGWEPKMTFEAGIKSLII